MLRTVFPALAGMKQSTAWPYMSVKRVPGAQGRSRRQPFHMAAELKQYRSLCSEAIERFFRPVARPGTTGGDLPALSGQNEDGLACIEGRDELRSFRE